MKSRDREGAVLHPTPSRSRLCASSLLFDNGAIAHRQIAVRFLAGTQAAAQGDVLAFFQVLRVAGRAEVDAPLRAAGRLEEQAAALAAGCGGPGLAGDDDEVAAVLDPRELEALRFGFRERVSDMEHAHIRELPRTLPALFAEAALRAEQAGFDGVELHYAHAYTMASFLSRTNTRDDGYGGARENRARLPLEVFAEVRRRFLALEAAARSTRVQRTE